jgi:type I restriction enzyme, R subunit
MRSLNFEFLRNDWPVLADLGGLAEQYAHPDPESALVKLRLFGEGLVGSVYDSLRLPRLPQSQFIDLLNAPAFRAATPAVVANKLHSLRVHGNRAAHGERCRPPTALWLLEEAFDLARWLVKAVARQAPPGAAFQPPPPPATRKSAEEALLEKIDLQERLKSVEATVARLMEEGQATRAKARVVEANAAELENTLRDGQQAADALSLDERATRRRMIDVLLLDVGWNVGPNGAITPQVGQEVAVPGQGPPDGEGAADYVLFDERRRTIGVVEAKRAAADPQQGLTQGQMYAAGLERDGVRPVIFATNGYEVWMWNDRSPSPETPRPLAGFYSPDSLAHLHHKREHQQPLATIHPREDIIPGRLYQTRAFRNVLARFAQGNRKTLLVLATGTGKTRVAVAIGEALLRAGAARRILFLCDRTELRRQAAQAFNQFLPNQPQIVVSARTANDRRGSVYLATYPAMMKCYAAFDAGFFDLAIIDEVHRSVFNRYREVIDYFDARQIGLTATPRAELDHDTFQLFDCDHDSPTDSYELEEAVANGHLVAPEVRTFEPKYLRDGLRYSRMTEEERRQLDEQVPDPTVVEFDREKIDRAVFDLETNRMILRNLMENGLRGAGGTRLGKTIFFARSERHARKVLLPLFYELFPEVGGNFCKVISHSDPRAEDLIDEFKRPDSELTVAISIDMLDTGIDVPQVVNLVFAKPVYSKIKFLQMIGRGTRTCEDLFGPRRDKTHFLIFDHWQNFEFHEEQGYRPIDTKAAKAITVSLFEARIALAEAALQQGDRAAFDLAVSLLRADIQALPRKSWFVRQQGQVLDRVLEKGVLEAFQPATVLLLKQQVAPLMRWRDVGLAAVPAYRFDELVTRLEADLVAGSATFADGKGQVEQAVGQLPVNLNPVRAKQVVMDRVRSADFWQAPTVADLETIRTELRGVMQYRTPTRPTPGAPLVVDIKQDPASVVSGSHDVKLAEFARATYEGKARKVLRELFAANPTLQKIARGAAVSDADLEALVSLVLTQSPDLDLRDLLEYYPETAGHLDVAIRGIIGQDAAEVERRFTEFANRHVLSEAQNRFLGLLVNHIRLYGSIRAERLWEDPFTRLHADGVEGVFRDETLLRELIDLVQSFQPEAQTGGPSE